MAIDDREKRMSVVGVGRPWLRSHHTATIDQQWRMNTGNTYGGNALTPGTTTVGRGLIKSQKLSRTQLVG